MPPLKKLIVLVFVLLGAFCATASISQAQTPTGTIAGHVVSADDQPLPGVTVSVMGPDLQGTRTAVTAVNGDYLVPLLPPGDYTVSFEIGSFQTVREVRRVAGTQTALLDVKMAPASVKEAVTVVADVQPFLETAQLGTNFKQDLMGTLPSARTLDSVLLMAPAVHPTGPRGAYTIAGAQSYENVYTLDGAIITENLRGAPFTLYIEDAIQETTVATGGVSAEYGRFDGGIANVITKSGGDIVSGSFRTSFGNDSWRSYTPFESTQRITNPTGIFKVDDTVPTYEETIGGPVKKSRLWYFGAARSQVQQTARTTANTNIPYVRTNDEQRYEGKLTYTPKQGHSIDGFVTKINQVLKNNTGSTVMDLKSLTDQGQPQDLWSIHYGGTVSQNLFVEGQYSQRHLKFTHVGSDATDLINGTMILDLSRNARFWSPTFCSGSACSGDEQRNNSDLVLKGSYFSSHKSGGSHHLVFGYDRYNDNIWANTHASGSDYRIRATGAIISGTDVYPQFIPGTTQIEYDPILSLSKGSNLVTDSLFANDSWRMNTHLTVNLGLRLDKNDATNGSGQDVGDKAALSPRVAATWDPKGDGVWSVSGSYARYVMALTSNLAGSTTAAGNSATFRWTYNGAAINGDATVPPSSLTPTAAALQQIFDWFNTNGGRTMTAALAVIPGVNMVMEHPLTSPYSHDYSGGVSRTLGHRGSIRADGTFRQYRNFYSLRTDLSTGQVLDKQNNVMVDKNVVENTDVTKRRYASLILQSTFHAANRWDIGGNYTLSRAYGNLEGETVNGGPSGASVLSYPEYQRESWAYPTGDLNIDQRHRLLIWSTYDPPIGGRGRFTVGLVQRVSSGQPYGATGSVPVRSFVTNPGYATPPSTETYYFTARDAFHTEGQRRTDLSLNYNFPLAHVGGTNPQLFAHFELLNMFNEFQLCGCGGTVFNDGGAGDLTKINTAITVISTAPFDPFNATPVEGVNWRKNASFGTAVDRFAFTTPRTFRFSVGVRF